MQGSAIEITRPSLPNGGGAIKGVGETFQPQEFTGTAALSIPIPTSSCRGFEPQLSVDYSSGSGGGVFGLGWALSAPGIARKTSKGIPRYDDSDTFILSGAEDLVPVEGGSRSVKVGSVDYLVLAYRPRIEGLFAKIERFVVNGSSDSYWRVITRDNVTSIYGASLHSRICDPEQPDHVFQWLLEETYDDKGNRAVYEYMRETAADIPDDLCEQSRCHGANRYLKCIKYANGIALTAEQRRNLELLKYGTEPSKKSAEWEKQTQVQGRKLGIPETDWHLEVVFDYGEHKVDPDGNLPYQPREDSARPTRRADPFSTYHAGFEIRTRWLCRNILMFHNFAELEADGPVLVHATCFKYRTSSTVTVLESVVSAGYRYEKGRYVARKLPPLSFGYTPFEPTAGEFAPFLTGDRKRLPGADSSGYQLVDLFGDGAPGVLYSDGASTLYWGPEAACEAVGAPVARYSSAAQPNTFPVHRDIGTPNQRLMDLTGNGQLDLVVSSSGGAGYYQVKPDKNWEGFRALPAVPTGFGDPDGQLIDLTGDGLSDLVRIEHDRVLVYPGRGRDGFGGAEACPRRTGLPSPAQTPRSEVVRFADMFGTGGNHLVQITSRRVKCWPHLGYGKFAEPILFGHAPELPDTFDAARLYLVDLDGSGTADIVYAHANHVEIWLNKSGNAFSKEPLSVVLPAPCSRGDQISFSDVLGTGTTALVFSDDRAKTRHWYIDLSQGRKAHLLNTIDNNLGATSKITYASSTRFSLRHKRDGRPWLTRLPFPVQVVEKIESFDHFSDARLVRSYSYRHGYYDGDEREFRGFGMVERKDAETLSASAEATDVPPVVTRTWYHTGVVSEDPVSCGYRSEYYAGDGGAAPLEDSPLGMQFRDGDSETRRYAHRALHGRILREEVYGEDNDGSVEPHPYTATESSYAVRQFQRRRDGLAPVLYVVLVETISYHYECRGDDPRVQHVLTLEADAQGNTLKQATIAYGRRSPDDSLPTPSDRDVQAETHVTYSENKFTNTIEHPNVLRAAVSCETVTFELTGYTPTGKQGRFQNSDFVKLDGKRLTHDFDAAIDYQDSPTSGKRLRRVIEHVRTLYRPDDLGAAKGNDPLALLPLGTVESLALPGETFKLAFTPGLITKVFQRGGKTLEGPKPTAVLGGQGSGLGGYVSGKALKAKCVKFCEKDKSDAWWMPAGRSFLSPNGGDDAKHELACARTHFFLPHRHRNPFHTANASPESTLTYDAYKLLLLESRDALGNRVTAGERLPDENIENGNDYHVLQPAMVTDPNGNRTKVAYDALGMVVGTAVMGKRPPALAEGDALEGFEPHLSQSQIDEFYDSDAPHSLASDLLNKAGTRFVYDRDRFRRTRAKHPKDSTKWQPAFAATLAREQHVIEPPKKGDARFQIGFSYSDGFGRQIQQRTQSGSNKHGWAASKDDLRWVCSGKSVFNNKGQAVRRYEPFSAETHRYETARRAGVSSIVFYDPLGRVVATLHPEHSWEKAVTTPWRQETWDASDTVLLDDPKNDRDVGKYIRGLPEKEYLPSWHTQNNDGTPEQQSTARHAAIHAGTPTIHHADTLSRTFLTVAHNKYEYRNSPKSKKTCERFTATRVVFDVEGNQRELVDAKDHVSFRYDYDMLGNRIHEYSTDAGERWMLHDVAGNPLCSWDSRGHISRTEYDPLRRPLRTFVAGLDGSKPNEEVLAERLVYGEGHPDAEQLNLKGRAFLHLDQAGALENERFDFKGNPLRVSRRIAREFRTAPDWSAADTILSAAGGHKIDFERLKDAIRELTDDKSYTSSTIFDALNRPRELTAPDKSIIRYCYNRASRLESIDANLQGVRKVGKPVWTSFVRGIAYDAKGQRTSVGYGNGASTVYKYDDNSFRLINLKTTRPVFADERDGGASTVQDLHYTYDAAGNITHIRDDAQQSVYFRNQCVEPHAAYTYDALHRLIEATGRQHLGQTESGDLLAATPGNASDSPRVGLLHRGDGKAMGRYRQEYHYDERGNILRMVHRSGDATQPDWTRTNTYGGPGNRLTKSQIGEGTPKDFSYDAHGNMTGMAHLSLMQWDHRDQLQVTAQQVVSDGGTPEKTWYVYDSAGQRVRKITERQAAAGKKGTRKAERIYLGGFEICRRFRADGETVTLHAETLHIMDGGERIALVERRTKGKAPTKTLIRYQFGNHLDSASLELDEDARVLSYEEFTPFGGTSYQAVRHQTDPPKRNRYSGKERDETTGLYYYGARYYAPWLGRWTSPDPAGTVDGLNLYEFVRGNPVCRVDVEGQQFRYVSMADHGTVNVENRQVNYGPAYGLDQMEEGTLEAHYGTEVTSRISAYNRSHATYVNAAEAAGRQLTEQESHRKEQGENAPSSSLNHIIASGTGQNVMNRETLRFRRGVDNPDRNRGFAQQIHAVVRMQRYSRAIINERAGETIRLIPENKRAFGVPENARGPLVLDQENNLPKARNQVMRHTIYAFQGSDTDKRYSSYKDVLKMTFDSPGNMRIGDEYGNNLASTGFDAPLDAYGNMTERAERLLAVHMENLPEDIRVNKGVFTTEQNNREVSSSRHRPPVHSNKKQKK